MIANMESYTVMQCIAKSLLHPKIDFSSVSVSPNLDSCPSLSLLMRILSHMHKVLVDAMGKSRDA